MILNHIFSCLHIFKTFNWRIIALQCCISFCCIATWLSIFPGGSDSKESASNAGDLSSIPASGRSPGEGKGYPLQCSCLENSMGRGARQATVHGVTKGRTWLSDWSNQIWCMHLWSESLQLCPILCHSVDCSPPGSSVFGILQARIVAWVSMPSSRGSSWRRDWTSVSHVSCIGRKVLYHLGSP